MRVASHFTVGLVACVITSGLTGCGSSSFVKQPAGWKSIELRDGLQQDYDDAWQTAVDTIARSYDIEIMDKDSGYLRTAWIFGILGRSSSAYAGRVTLKFPDVQEPQRVDVKTDAKQFNNWTDEWVEGFDSQFERDIVAELSGRLGRTTQ